jgi:hypothetical protein
MSSAISRTISAWRAECHSLFNIARMLGGNLPKDCATLITPEVLEMAAYEIVLTFPSPRRLRKKAAV